MRRHRQTAEIMIVKLSISDHEIDYLIHNFKMNTLEMIEEWNKLEILLSSKKWINNFMV